MFGGSSIDSTVFGIPDGCGQARASMCSVIRSLIGKHLRLVLRPIRPRAHGSQSVVVFHGSIATGKFPWSRRSLMKRTFGNGSSSSQRMPCTSALGTREDGTRWEVNFQMAEVVIPRDLFRGIHATIRSMADAVSVPSGRATTCHRSVLKGWAGDS